MSLPHILLGLLAEPISGYEIKQKFDETLRHFWFAELSQLYPALKKLVAEDLATVESVPSDKGPAKKLYCRTQKGRRTLVDWIASGPASAPLRHPFLAQVFFLNEQGSPEEAMAYFRKLKSRFNTARMTLEAIEHEWKANDPGYPDKLSDETIYMQMTLEIGINVQKTYEDWCDRCITRIRKRMRA